MISVITCWHLKKQSYFILYMSLLYLVFKESCLFYRKKVVRRVRRLNPLTNTRAMLHLNPYAAVLKRQAILATEKRQFARDEALAKKRGVSAFLFFLFSRFKLGFACCRLLFQLNTQPWGPLNCKLVGKPCWPRQKAESPRRWRNRKWRLQFQLLQRNRECYS